MKDGKKGENRDWNEYDNIYNNVSKTQLVNQRKAITQKNWEVNQFSKSEDTERKNNNY